MEKDYNQKKLNNDESIKQLETIAQLHKSIGNFTLMPDNTKSVFIWSKTLGNLKNNNPQLFNDYIYTFYHHAFIMTEDIDSKKPYLQDLADRIKSRGTLLVVILMLKKLREFSKAP